MSKTESDVRMIFEQIAKLPEEARERISYVVQGALLVAENYTVKTEQQHKPPEKTA